MGRILRTRCARAILFQTKLSILASGTIGASPRPVGARVVRPVHGPNPPDSLRSRKSAPGRFVDSRLRHHRGLTASSERASCSARPWAESFGLAALALFCSRQNCRFSPPAPSGPHRVQWGRELFGPSMGRILRTRSARANLLPADLSILASGTIGVTAYFEPNHLAALLASKPPLLSSPPSMAGVRRAGEQCSPPHQRGSRASDRIIAPILRSTMDAPAELR